MKKQDGCVYNEGVKCYTRSVCYNCGWNPNVAELRNWKKRRQILPKVKEGLNEPPSN